MNKLENKSTLYKALSERYDCKYGDITTLDFFRECVNWTISTSDTIEINYVLYRLEYLIEDIDTGIATVNQLARSVKYLTSDNDKITFIIKVLKTALEQMK